MLDKLFGRKFRPYIENRQYQYRKCGCGQDHEVKVIRGLFHYEKNDYTIFCACLVEHQKKRHVWLSFVTGEWPGTNYEDCFVTADIWQSENGIKMRIEDSIKSPFTSEEIVDSYPVSREQVLSVEGAKEWIHRTYLSLFNCDEEIGTFTNT